MQHVKLSHVTSVLTVFSFSIYLKLSCILFVYIHLLSLYFLVRIFCSYFFFFCFFVFFFDCIVIIIFIRAFFIHLQICLFIDKFIFVHLQIC